MVQLVRLAEGPDLLHDILLAPPGLQLQQRRHVDLRALCHADLLGEAHADLVGLAAGQDVVVQQVVLPFLRAGAADFAVGSLVRDKKKVRRDGENLNPKRKPTVGCVSLAMSPWVKPKIPT